MKNIIGRIIAYEHGEQSATETLDMFAEMVGSGMVWELQGSYQRAAAGLIDNGFLTSDGDVTESGRAMAKQADGGA